MINLEELPFFVFLRIKFFLVTKTNRQNTNDSAQETMVIREHSVPELLELWKTFKQVIKEPVAVWFLKLCDMGIADFSQTAAEAEKLNI